MKNPKKAKQRRLPTESELLDAVHLIRGRLHRGFTLFLWITRICPMLRDHKEFDKRTNEIISIKSACVESTLMSIRDLDDFFRSRNGTDRDSDLRAEDYFGFKSPGPFLSVDERNSINQWLAHLTYQPVWSGLIGTNAGNRKQWDGADLLGKAARAVFAFFAYLEENLPEKHAEAVADIRKAREAMEHGLRDMEAWAALERKFLPELLKQEASDA